MKILSATSVALVFCLSITVLAQQTQIDSDTFGGYQARAIGPAVMGGRVADIDAVIDKRLTIYVGSAGGGLWKSSDAGTTFKPVFDKQPSLSIGAVKVDPNDPKTIWVGTGESWTRNSVSIGTGLYRSKDGGDTWQRVGLENSERIARIVINPKDSNNVFVCVPGHLWNSHPERGLFKTVDGGKSWNKILYIDDNTGCADLAMDPENPQILYAGMWQFRRKPYTFASGGPTSGFYKTSDGGAHWQQLTNGLPSGTLGRIAVAVAPSKHNVVYALVEAKRTALYRSDDSGGTWSEKNSDFNMVGRPFYFARIVVDPSNPDRVYKPGFGLTVSDDGGKSFAGASVGPGGGPHGDIHAVWVNPKNTDELLVATDGGVYQSEDRGAHWRYLSVLPISQFYHITYDMAQPFNVYGGLQDNGTWMGPSHYPGGIHNRDWHNIGYGDGMWVQVDPKDQDTVYVEYQGAKISRFRKSILERKDIRPLPRPGEPDFRFNWNSPIHIGPSGALYLGGQFLFRSTNQGDSWDRISPDLTTGNPEWLKQEESGGVTIDNSDAEKYETIFAISESAKDPKTIWVGTDDGNVQLTRDGGKTWTNLVKNIPGLPANAWVSGIEASHFDPAMAYASFDNHMTGDMKPYVYKTADYGKSWQQLSGEGISGYAHVVREDVVNRNLLFVGTELGLFLSLDGGAHWAQFTGNVPNVAVRDVVVHPRDGDLLIATHGRGVYVLDDLTPIRKMTPEVLESDAAFLDARPSIVAIPTGEQRFDADSDFNGRALEESAHIIYYQKKRHIIGDLKFEIYNQKGELVSTLAGNKRKGLNRLEWPMRLKPPRVPAGASTVPNQFASLGPHVPTGTYTVKMIKGNQTYTSKLELIPDPRSHYSQQDRDLQQQSVLTLYKELAHLTYVADAVVDARDQARRRLTQLPKDAQAPELQRFADTMENLRSRLVAVKEGGAITGEEKLRERLGDLYSSVNEYDGRPTQSQLDSMQTLSAQLNQAEADFQKTISVELPVINPVLEQKKLDTIKPLTREDWEKKQAP
ncbi:MAG TPA: glycosyl hydrolase [Candidatus Angelobacter sp.]|nr:glycosyl hydrolase [Candidatus Angelobacter sp.]